MSLKIGLVGFGDQARDNLVPAILGGKLAVIEAIAEFDKKRRDEIFPALGNARVYDDAFDLFEHPGGLDAIVAASWPDVHFKLALEAMGRDLPIFVEKPPCFCLSELEALIDKAHRTGAINGVGMNYRFAGPIVELRAKLAGGRLGKPTKVEVRHEAAKPRQPMWGLDSMLRTLLLTQSIHGIDLAVQIGGGEVVDIGPVVYRNGEILNVLTVVEFPGSVFATISTSNNAPVFGTSLSVLTDKAARLSVEDLGEIVVQEMFDKKTSTQPNKLWREMHRRSPVEGGYARPGYSTELDEFFQAVRDKRPFSADFESLRPTYEIIERICKYEPDDAVSFDAPPSAPTNISPSAGPSDPPLPPLGTGLGVAADLTLRPSADK